MKKAVLLIFILSTIIVCNLLFTCNPQNQISKTIVPDQKPIHSNQVTCDDTLWNHVYHSYRLQVIEKCKTVTGIILKVKQEKDGDSHILLELDPGQENLLNNKNYKKQKGCLVLEPVCISQATQEDSRSSCTGYINNVYIPQIGEHVQVTGSWVTDTHHGWNEIHPVTKITVTK
jgi:hypothetical protein